MSPRILAACALLLPLAALAATLEGRVVKVADGDTITVLASNVQHKVRLSGIDAPEKRQAFGEASRRHLASLVAGKDVKVEWTKKDRYGRILGTVWASVPADGTRATPCVDVNLRMIQDGFAWHYSHFDNTQSYADAEAAARTAKRGLWKDHSPIPPHEFRKAKRKMV